MSSDKISERRVRAVIDIQNYFLGTKQLGEDVSDFIKRRTLEFIFNLSKNTNSQTLQTAALTSALYKFLKQVKPPSKQKDATALDTLGSLGFTHHPQLGDENDCALRTIYHQLTQRHKLDLKGNFDTFRDYIRLKAGFQFGSMIDILNNGQPLLAAVQDYLVNVAKLPLSGLVVDVWSATAEGGLMEFQNVAQQAGGGRLVLTFYFNGINHFDSLTGGLVRN